METHENAHFFYAKVFKVLAVHSNGNLPSLRQNPLPPYSAKCSGFDLVSQQCAAEADAFPLMLLHALCNYTLVLE